jgi:hypothetical protein
LGCAWRWRHAPARIRTVACASSRLTTASQLAAALGKTRQAIYAGLADVPAAAAQPVRAWRLADLPPALCSELAAVAQRRGCKSAEQLLADPPRPWQPPGSSAALPEPFQHEAEQWRGRVAAILQEFADDPQNGKMLPGVSPAEAWWNGIGGKTGVADKPLRRLLEEARFLLATHKRPMHVTPQGIRFHIGKREWVYWGEPLAPYVNSSPQFQTSLLRHRVLSSPMPQGTPHASPCRRHASGPGRPLPGLKGDIRHRGNGNSYPSGTD